MAVFCGLPLVALEQVMGQYVGLGVLPFWNICPLFKGIGVSFCILNLLLAVYYILVIVYAIYYVYRSVNIIYIILLRVQVSKHDIYNIITCTGQ